MCVLLVYIIIPKTMFRKHVVYTSITNSQYVMSQKVNKLLNDNIHRTTVTSLRDNKITASMKYQQTQLNKNSLLISGTHTTLHDMTSYNFDILCIITFNFHQINFNFVRQWNQFYFKIFIHVIRDLVGNNNSSIANCIFCFTKKK
jgi:hypothetical protein